jgi:signal transduction histidine kinase
MFNQKPNLVFKMLTWLFPVLSLIHLILAGPILNPIFVIVITLIVILFSTQVLSKAWKNNKIGVWSIAGGFLGLIVGNVAIIFYQAYSPNLNLKIFYLLVYIANAAFPIGLIAFMASRFRDLYSHLEQKIEERTTELKKSLADLKSTQSQLIQSAKMASLGELTAGIAHEIQNPLNFVNNFSEVNAELIGEMEDEIDNGNLEEAKKIAGSIRENQQKINQHGKRADSIVKGMLQHSRSSSGVKELTDINALAEEFLRLSYHGLRAKDKSFNATLKSDFDSSIGMIRIVSDEIGRVILNLLNNAFYAVSEKKKQNPEGYEPTVSISTHLSGNHVEIKVGDNGNGISQNILDKIFQPFFTTKPTGMGTGLGLSMSYDIVKAHGGEL